MAFTVGDLFAVTYSRSVGYVIRGLPTAGQWTAFILGGSEGAQFTVFDADDGGPYSRLAPTATPAGFSPSGDLVTFRSGRPWRGIGPATPLDAGPVQEGLVFGWYVVAYLSGPVAVVYVPRLGASDVPLIVAVSEISMRRKNPS